MALGKNGKSNIEHSRTEWHTKDNNGEYPGDEKIKIGLMQRMANSLERMEKPFKDQIEKAERYERWYYSQEEINNELRRKISALKGVISKLKEKKP